VTHHNTTDNPGHHALGGAADPHERLSADDLATQREGQFLAAALAAQARQAAGQRHTPGTCANCAAQCLPLAVFCDEDCRADHEHRLLVQRRQGLRR
jgi:hypothetical protein